MVAEEARLVVAPVLAILVALAVVAAVRLPSHLRHGWESHAFWQVRKRVGQLPLVGFVVVETAVLAAKLALLAGGDVLALDGLEVGVDGA